MTILYGEAIFSGDFDVAPIVKIVVISAADNTLSRKYTTSNSA